MENTIPKITIRKPEDIERAAEEDEKNFQEMLTAISDWAKRDRVMEKRQKVTEAFMKTVPQPNEINENLDEAIKSLIVRKILKNKVNFPKKTSDPKVQAEWSSFYFQWAFNNESVIKHVHH